MQVNYSTANWGNFEALRSPASAGFPPQEAGDRRSTPERIRDDSALYNESESRSRTPRSKGLRRPESFSVRPNKKQSLSTSNVPSASRPMSWQSAARSDRDPSYGRPSVWHNRTSSAGQGSFVSASDLGRHYASSEIGGSEKHLPTSSSWQSDKDGTPPPLPRKAGFYDSVSRDSGLNVSPDGYRDHDKENEQMKVSSMQDISWGKWNQGGYNNYVNTDRLSVDTNAQFSSETPPHAQSSPNIIEDVSQNPIQNVPPRPPRVHPSFESAPKPPGRDVSSIKHNREMYHAKSSSLPVSMGSQPLFLAPQNCQDLNPDQKVLSAERLHMRGYSRDQQTSPLDLQKSPGLSKSMINDQRSFSYRGNLQPELQIVNSDLKHSSSSSIDRINQNPRGGSLQRGAPPKLSDIIPPPPTTPASPLKIGSDGYPSVYNHHMKPCYNTSTQTDSVQSSPVGPGVNKSDVQCETTDSLHRPMKKVVPTEENSAQTHSPPWSTSSLLSFEGETGLDSHSPGLVDSREAGYRGGPIVNQLEQNRRIPETIREDSPSLVVEAPKVNGPAEIISRIHEHSPSQTSMLRKLSMELYGAQGHFNNKNAPGQRSNPRLLDPHAPRQHTGAYVPKHVRSSESRDSGFSSLDLQLSVRDDDSVYTASHAGSFSNMSGVGLDKFETDDKNRDKNKVKEQQPSKLSNNSTEQKNIPKEIPPTNFSRQSKNQLSLRKAYGIFEEVDIDEPKHGKSSSYIDLLNSNKPKDKAAKDRRRSEEPKHKEKEVSGFQKFFGKKLKRTSSDNLRPEKEKARQEAKQNKDDEYAHRRRSHSEYPADKHEIRSRQGSDPTSQIKRESQSATEQRSLRSSEPVPQVRPMSTSQTAPNLHDANSSGDSDTVFNTKQLTSVHSSSISAIDDRLSPEKLDPKQQAVLDFYKTKVNTHRSSLPNKDTKSEQYLPVFSEPVTEAIAGIQTNQTQFIPPQQLPRKNSDNKNNSVTSESAIVDGGKRSSISRLSDVGSKQADVKTSENLTASGSSAVVPSVEKAGKTEILQEKLSPTSHSSEGNYAELETSSPSLTVVKPTFTQSQKHHSYQLSANKSLEEEDEAPPALPPRNYNLPSTQSDPHKSPNTLSPSYNNMKQKQFENFEKTPKEEEYADKLRQQAKRFSQPASTTLNAAGYQHKRLPETKSSISQSKPVERSVVERQECHTPPPPADLSLKVAPQDLKLNSYLSAESVEFRTASDKSSFSSKYKRLSTGSTSAISPGYDINGKNTKRWSVGEPMSPVFSKEKGYTYDQLMPSSKPAERKDTDRPSAQRPTSIVEIVEMPRKQIVMPYKSNKEVTDQLYEKATAQEKENKTSQSRPKSAGARVPGSKQESTLGSVSVSQTWKTPTSQEPSEHLQTEPQTNIVKQVPFKFKPKGEISGNTACLQGPKPWVAPSSKSETQTLNGSSTINSTAPVITSVPVHHVQSVAKPLTHRHSSRKSIPYNHSSVTNLKVSVIPSNPDPVDVITSPTVDKHASPSVRSSINKLENTDPKEGKMDWHNSSRNKIKELRRKSEEGGYSIRRMSDPKEGNHHRSSSGSGRHPATLTVMPNRTSPVNQNGGVEHNGRGASPRTPPLTNGAITIENENKSFTSHNAKHNSIGVNPANPQVSCTSLSDKSDSAVISDDSPVQRPRIVSEEEQLCNEHASLLASQMKDTDRRLSEILSPPAEHKTTTFFMDGIFDTDVDLSRSPSILQKVDRPKVVRRREESPPQRPTEKSDSLPRPNQSSTTTLSCSLPRMSTEHNESAPGSPGSPDSTLDEQKEVLIARIEKKLQILEDEKEFLQDEVAENDRLGTEVTAIVEQKCKTKGEFDKYKLYVDELDKVMLLLLRVSGRLAKAQNALQGLPEDASRQQRALLTSKRDEISQKHEDAIQLKEGIDRRRHLVDKYLNDYLSPEEFLDYEHFIKMKSKLTMERQELEDKVRLGEEQLKGLQSSLDSPSQK